ncbi:hypothetical protein PVMG_05349 [Plasmodium vivax Mauritania I]|uniref:Uncharacterized protein n=1 Tax=Plasmodium vivax Mauritania I TaxID=1035515 RepID=A0A0J9TJ86_PLAVI|nr:hypothetical protein PVMG_05349 [Plasmodium vivax Mauritania I]
MFFIKINLYILSLNQYPFLYDVWFTYNQFGESMIDDANRESYGALCHQILDNMKVDGVHQYKDVCMKLMRNLKRHIPFSKYFDPTLERCNILYNWIYNLIQQNQVTEDVIKNCFEEYVGYKKEIESNRTCNYFSYINLFEEPMKIILLDIFENNMEIMRKELNNNYASTEIPLKKFLCESLKIYKHMNESYCKTRDESNEKHRHICTKLDIFKSTYSLFRTNLGNLNTITPELDDIDKGFLDQCKLVEQKRLLDSDQGKNSCHAKEKGMTASVKISGNFLHGVFPTFPADGVNTLQEDMPTRPGNEDNSMKKTITTTVGTVAGASSLLALLYRVIQNVI